MHALQVAYANNGREWLMQSCLCPCVQARCWMAVAARCLKMEFVQPALMSRLMVEAAIAAGNRNRKRRAQLAQRLVPRFTQEGICSASEGNHSWRDTSLKPRGGTHKVSVPIPEPWLRVQSGRSIDLEILGLVQLEYAQCACDTALDL